MKVHYVFKHRDKYDPPFSKDEDWKKKVATATVAYEVLADCAPGSTHFGLSAYTESRIHIIKNSHGLQARMILVKEYEGCRDAQILTVDLKNITIVLSDHQRFKRTLSFNNLGAPHDFKLTLITIAEDEQS